MYLHASNGPVSLQQSVTLPDSKCDSPGAAKLCLKAMSLGGKGRLAVVGACTSCGGWSAVQRYWCGVVWCGVM
jgi:hypothetical protein